MRRMYKLLVAVVFALLAHSGVNAQITGTKTIGVDYPTLNDALIALNTSGINGNVIINVPAGYTETAPVGGFVLGSTALNATTSTTNTLTIRKDGSGADPVLFSQVGTTTNLDGIFFILGADYVTIDGIDLQESPTNTTATTQMEFGYALLKLNGVAPFDGCQFVSIKNCSITLARTNIASIGIYAGNHTTAATTALTITSTADANSNCSFHGNTIENVNTGIALRGFAAAAPHTLYDQNNDVGGTSSATGNTIRNFAGTAVGSGVNAQNQNNLNVAYNNINNFTGVGAVAATNTLYGVWLQSGTNTSANITYNTVNLTTGSAAFIQYGISTNFATTGSINVNYNTLTANGGSTSVIYLIHFSGAIANITTNYNSFYNVNVSTTGALYLIFHTGSASPINNRIIGNYTDGPTTPYIRKTGAGGSVYGYYNFAVTTGGTTIFRDNNFSHFNMTGSVTFYGIFEHNGGSGQTKFMDNNTVSNVTGTAGNMYGISMAYSATQSMTNNRIFNFTGGAANLYGINVGVTTNIDTIANCRVSNFTTSGNVYGINLASTFPTMRIYNDTINALTSTGTTGLAYGIFQSVGTNIEIYRTQIYNIAANGTGSSVNGMYLNSGTALVHNNLVGDLRTPAYTTATANAGTQLVGIYCGAGTAHTLLHNTVVLAGTSTGANFGSSAVFAATTATTFRNNIFINNSTPNGTGMVTAYRRSSTTLTGYQAASNNNLFYAGVPAANRTIMFDGTVSYQTLNSYKTLVSPRDANSVTENTTFQSLVGGASNFLRPSLSVATQVESNGGLITGFTDDIYNTVRGGYTGYTGTGVAPDLGAVEDNYIPSDMSAPAITLAALPFTCNTGDRVFTANITDVTGVASGASSPRVYYRKGTGAWYSSPGALSSGSVTSGVWSFTISATDMGGITAGDVISYFVIAQDIVATPNVGSLPFGAIATDVNTIGTFPTTPSTYTINTTLTGVINVGVGQTYTTITAAANAYNNNCISGPVTFRLMDATYPSETFPITFQANPFASATNTLTIQPNAGTAVTINGLAGSVALFKFLNASFINLDGLNSGGASLTLNATNTGANSVVWLASTATPGSGCNSIGIRNLNINGGINTSTTNWAIVAGIDGATPSNTAAPDIDNITIQGNNIQRCGYAVAGFGTSNTSAGGWDNWVISNNIVGPATYSATANLGFNGIFTGSHVNLTISGNTFQNIGLVTSTTQTAGVVITANVNGFNLVNNTIKDIRATTTSSGLNSVCGVSIGNNVINYNILRNNITNISNINTGGYGARAIILNTSNASNGLIANNMISNIFGLSNNGINFWNIGITIEGATGGLSLYHNAINLYGSFAGLNAALGTRSACLSINTSGSNLDIRNNILTNTYDNTTNTTDLSFAIYASATSALANLNFNNYFVSGIQGVLGNLAGTNLNTLADIQASLGGNLNSINTQPSYSSNTDLRLLPDPANIPFGAGTPLAAVTTDIDGLTRSTTAPVMGVNEVNLVTFPPTIVYTPLNSSCTTGDQIITATIGDTYTGVPTTGPNVPRIYYRKNTGAWLSAAGTLSSGDATSGVWSFNMTASSMGGLTPGDAITYYIVAQSVGGLVGARPFPGFSATSVNSITTPPASPNTFNILPVLSGSYNVGVGQAFTTLTSAINAYNGSCIGGPVTFLLTDATYPSETFPITIATNAFASSTNTLTIKPATGVNASITGTSTAALIKLDGADYVTIDGSNDGSTSRNLSLTNNNTTTSAVIWNASMNSTNGATFNTFKNLNIRAGANTTATVIGIASTSTNTLTTQGDDNDNLTIQNCSITRAYHGISILGTPGFPHNNVVITDNSIGSLTAAEHVKFFGIYVVNQTGLTISRNNIFEMKNTTLTNIAAIELGANIVGASITRNIISGIWQQSTGGWGAYGIDFNGTGSSDILITNNMISNIQTINYSSTSTLYNAFGIRTASAVNNIRIYHNSINLYGNITISATAGMSSCVLFSAANTNIDMRNNVFVNTMSFSPTGSLVYAVFMSAAQSFTNINNNSYFVQSSGTTSGHIGRNLTANVTTLAAWQGVTGQDLQSLNVNAAFVAPTDLRLQTVAANIPLVSGTFITQVPIDIDGATRSTSTPVLGVHEVVFPPCSGMPVAGTANASVTTGCATFTSNLTTTGATVGVSALAYQWQVSDDNVLFTDIPGATTPAYQATVTATKYYRSQLTCTTSSQSDVTPGVLITSNPNPLPITGTFTLCPTTTTALVSATSGGTWSSSTPARATIDATSGLVTGVSAGTTTISYALSTGCLVSEIITVRPAPSAITITPAGSPTVCLGSSVTLNASTSATTPILQVFNGDFNSALAPWTVDNTGSTNPAATQWARYTNGTSLASTVHTTPDGSAFAAANSDAGGSGSTTSTALISPMFSLEGYISASVSFQQFYRYISSDVNANIEISTNGGTTWTTLFNYRTGAASVGSGTSFATSNVDLTPYVGNDSCRIRFYYNGSFGWTWAIDNVNVTAVPPPTYTWAGVSSATGLGCETCATNTITPTALGTNVYTVVATAGGCSSSTSVSVSVNPVPPVITGTPQVCVGLTTALANTDPSGTWSSTNTAVATIGSATGSVIGVSAGTTTVSYTYPSTGCARTQVVTVNPLPAAITDVTAVCENATVSLTNSDGGGSWSTASAAIATASGTSGVVSGVLAGTTRVTYTLPTGCITSKILTVNPSPIVTVTPTSATTFCIGDSTSAYSVAASMPVVTLLNQNFNSGLGEWSTANAFGDPSAYWQIVPSPGAEGTAGDGTPMMQAYANFAAVNTALTSPSFSTVGFSSATLSFNNFIFSDVTDLATKVEFTTNNGATWSTLIDYTGAIDGTGVFSPSSPEASVPLPAAALGQSDVKLRWSYNAAFWLWIIDNIKVTATVPAATYAWSGGSDLSCNTCTNPTITPSNSGTQIYNASGVSSLGCITSIPVTINVNPLPAVIGGNHEVCVASTTTLTNADAAGTWSSSNTSVATINATTGVVTGIAQGTTIITYTLPTTCIRTSIVTVHPLPNAITGTAVVCEGLNTSLANTTADGTWSSTNTAVATIDASGIVTGIVAGTTNISYTLATGCASVQELTVNPLPADITGTTEVCKGLTTTLSNTTPDGTWSSSNTSVATINATGIVEGIVAGSATITYTLPTGCIKTTLVTVHPLPAAITGTLQVCEGLTTALADVTPDGTWSSSNTSVATIDASGVVSAILAGNTTITYTLPTGCIATDIVTVNPLPADITGTFEVCEGLTTNLSNATADGTWSSSNTSIASVVSTTGVVTGNVFGTATITYTLPTGCIKTSNVTVNPLPAEITGTMQVCEGLTTTLSNATPDGVWSSSNTTIATIDASGIVTANVAGTTIITYMLPTGCIKTTIVTVNPLPATIAGTLQVCEGLTTSLTNTSAGGTWSSGLTSVATINATSGILTGVIAGFAPITYTLPTGCINTTLVTVNPLPNAISGIMEVCEGLTTTLNNTTALGTWSSGATSVATIDVLTGTVTGHTAGTTIITYTLPTGCIATAIITVNPLPAIITGVAEVCQGLTTTLASTTPSGVWISDNTTVAAIDVLSGVVTGGIAGTANITYVLATGCQQTKQVTVHPTPASITGVDQVCVASSITLSNIDPLGTWSSGTTSVATIDAATGILTGVAAGSTIVTYTLPTTCINTMAITVHPLPVVQSINGGGSYCAGGSGVAVGLVNSELGTTYTLYMGTTVMGTQVGTGASISFGSYTAAGTYSVSAATSFGCTLPMTGTVSVSIIPLVTPAVSLSVAPGDTVCAGTNTSFVATPTNGGTTPTYVWSVNGSLVTGTGDSYTYVPANGDIVSVTMTSSEACPSPATASANRNMVVVSNETPVVTIAVGPNDTLCQGSTAVYGATSLFGGDAPVYTWFKNGITTGITGNVYSYIPLDGDVITAQLNSNYRCPIVNNVNSNAITMQIDSIYIPAVIVTPNTGLSIRTGQTVVFTATVANAGTNPTYQWIRNSTLIVGATTNTWISNTIANNDSVSCVVYGTGDCSYLSFNSIIMKVTNGIVETNTDWDVKMMPNPNAGDFTVTGTLAQVGSSDVNFEVIDMLGHVVYKNTVTTKSATFSEKVKLSNTLANGMYMLNVRSGSDVKSFHFVLRQ